MLPFKPILGVLGFWGWPPRHPYKIQSFMSQFLIINCLAHRPPTEMGQYSMERYCPEYFRKYRTIYVGCL